MTGRNSLLLVLAGAAMHSFVGCSSSGGGGGAGVPTGGASGTGAFGGGGSGGTSGVGGSGGVAGSGGASGVGGGPTGLTLPFKPSNVDDAPYENRVLKDFEVREWNQQTETPFEHLEGLRVDTTTLKVTYYDWPENKKKDVPGAGSDYIFEAVAQTQGGPEVAVLVVNSLTVAAGKTVIAEGSRPLVIVSAKTITLNGDLDVTAGATPPPPGAYGTNGIPGIGPGGGKPGMNNMYAGGAGGGAFCSPGGRGGNDYSNLSGGDGGAPYGSSSIIPLQGGSSGARARLSNCAAGGGNGGGAVQLVAAQSIAISGYISAPGVGGCPGYDWGGSGGGSGGAVLIEAPEVTLNGTIAVNGGGGGGDHNEGSSGTNSELVAFGDCKGNGAAGLKQAMDGEDNNATSLCDAPGGGGGGAGWIRFNTLSGKIVQGGNAVLSPAVSTSCATMGTLAS